MTNYPVVGPSYYNQKNLTKQERWLQLTARKSSICGASKYRGVSSYIRPSNEIGWKAVLIYDGRRYYGGAYETEEEAAAAWNNLALSVIGPVAEQRLNQINTQPNENQSA